MGNDQVIARNMFGFKDRKDQDRYGNMRTRGGLMYYHYDALGNVSDLSDHLGANIVKYRFDAFGGMFAGTLAPYSFKGITGKDYDPKSGLMFYNSRWYDPHVGRFTQPDTFKGFPAKPGTQHPYAYVGNNPINNLNPTGHLIIDDIIDIINDIIDDLFDDDDDDDDDDGGGGGGSHTPTLEEREQDYDQASQPIPLFFQISNTGQKVNYKNNIQSAPGLSNYRYLASNNETWQPLSPIRLLEQDRKNNNGAAIVLGDSKAVYGAGHAAVVIVDTKGAGRYYSQGPEGGHKGLTDTGKKLEEITPTNLTPEQVQQLSKKTIEDYVGRQYDNFVYIDADSDAVDAMLKKAEELRQRDYNYNVLTNNCVQYVDDVLDAGGIINTGKEPLIPNDYVEALEYIYENSATTLPNDYPSQDQIIKNTREWRISHF